MKKLVVAIVLIAVLVGGTFGGLAAANGGPALRVVGNVSPGDITVSGTGWVPGLPVDLFFDTQDANHHVAVAIPDTRGGFTTKFGLLGTLIGDHVVIGVQGFGPPVNVPFTIKNASPVDDRTCTDLVDNPAYGLKEIKREVAGIEGNVTSPDFGLAEIKDEVRDIEDAVQMLTVGDCRALTGSLQKLYEDSQTNPKHVHLTVARQTGTGNFDLQITIRVGQVGDLDAFDLVNAVGVAPGVYTYEFDCVGFRLWAKSGVSGDLCYTLTNTYPPWRVATAEPWPEEP